MLRLDLLSILASMCFHLIVVFVKVICDEFDWIARPCKEWLLFLRNFYHSFQEDWGHGLIEIRAH